MDTDNYDQFSREQYIELDIGTGGSSGATADTVDQTVSAEGPLDTSYTWQSTIPTYVGGGSTGVVGVGVGGTSYY